MINKITEKILGRKCDASKFFKFDSYILKTATGETLEYRFKKGTKECLGFWVNGKKDEDASHDYIGLWKTFRILKERGYKKL